jgi:hypothetical protein
MDNEAVIAKLKAQIARAGTMRAWAREHAIDPPYVHRVLTGQKPPGPQILTALGLRKDEVNYRKDRADG